MALSPGTRLGAYEIGGMIAAGGMGEVYRARDTRIGRAVAVKILPQSFASDADRLMRFEQEARTVSSLSHPNLLALFDVGEYEGVPYLVSELLEGDTLRGRLRDGALPQRKAVDFACQIAEGLAAAHEKGIVHRDLKPENIFVTRDGRVKILDFGLAKLAHGRSRVASGDDGTATVTAQTSPGMVLGTTAYMAPEQVRAQEMDARADLFSFGTILYEMLSGDAPFRRENRAETMSAILKDDAPDLKAELHVAPGLEKIVHRCLEKDPADRFQSAKDLAFALEALTGSGMTAAQAPRARRLPLMAIAVGVAAIAMIAAAAWKFYPKKAQSTAKYQQLTFRRGSLQAARFAPDGVGVIYSAQWEGAPPEVQTTRLGDSEFRSLGLPAATVAAVSSQGEMAILLGCEPFFVSDCGGTLAKVSAGGGAPRQLLENVHYADWSPDGAEMAVVTQDPNGHNRLEYPVGHVVYETSGWISAPRISPDGKWVAFSNHPVLNDDRGDVAVVSRDGHARTLAANFASVEGVAWEPGGKEIWFAASDEKSAWAGTLYTTDLAGKRRVVVHMPGMIRLHDISRDGRVLISHELWRHQIIGFFPGDQAEHSYSWMDWTIVSGSGISSDGKKILFTEAGGAAWDGYKPYLRPADGSPATRLGTGGAVALSPDGKWAAVEDFTANTLSLVPTGVGKSRTLDKGPLQQYDFPGWWSSDGKTLTFAAQEAGHGFCIYAQDVAGGAPHRVTPEMQYVGMLRPHFAVSSDVKLTALIPAGAAKIHLFDDGGRDLGELRGGKEGEAPAAFAKDGRLIVGPMQAGWPLQLFLVDPKSGRREPWKQLAPPDRTGVRADWDLAVTPDLKYYAYDLTQANSELYVVEFVKE